MSENQGEEQTMPWAWVKDIDERLNKSKSQFNYRNPSLPVEILPWLLLSDEETAQDTKILKSLGVTHVLSLNGTTSFQCQRSKDLYDTLGIFHKRIHALDEEGYNMIDKHWDECHAFLEKACEIDNPKVVIHCVSGINRSGIIACTAMMIFEQVTVVEAVKHCIEQRKTLLWNKSFRRQLCLFAAQQNLLGPKPEEYDNSPIIETLLPPPPIKSAFDRLTL